MDFRIINRKFVQCLPFLDPHISAIYWPTTFILTGCIQHCVLYPTTKYELSSFKTHLRRSLQSSTRIAISPRSKISKSPGQNTREKVKFWKMIRELWNVKKTCFGRKIFFDPQNFQTPLARFPRVQFRYNSPQRCSYMSSPSSRSVNPMSTKLTCPACRKNFWVEISNPPNFWTLALTTGRFEPYERAYRVHVSAKERLSNSKGSTRNRPPKVIHVWRHTGSGRGRIDFRSSEKCSDIQCACPVKISGS